MIAKHVPMKSIAKSDFASLVHYLCDAQHKEERLGWVAVTNCCSSAPDAAAREVLATQARNTRAKSDRTYHLIVSFRPGEQVDEATCRRIEARLCDGLGLGVHQRVSAMHHDTDSLHLHIAINKIHPARYTIHNPYYDHPKLGQLCTELEREYHLVPDNHCVRQRGAACRAADMERHGGLESLLGWIRRECLEVMLAAQSWPALHRVLQTHGLALHERGTGLVVVAGNGTAVKASSIDPSFSRPKLERRLGAYALPEAGGAVMPAAKSYHKKPLLCRIDTTALYARYCQAQQQAGARSAAERATARAVKERQIATAKARARLKRASIRLLSGPGLAKRLLYRGVSKTLRDELHRIHATYREQRQAISSRYQRRNWVDWLRAKAMDGDQQALTALRARAAAPGLTGNTMTGTGRHTGARIAMRCDSITKNGTVIYRFGSTAVRDDGDKLTVSRGATEEGLRMALRMAAQHYGPHLRVSGTVDFRAQIVQAAVDARLAVRFDDALLEHRRQSLQEQATVRVGARYQAKAGYRQRIGPSRLDQNAPTRLRTAAGMQRGSGRHRTGP